MEKEKKNINNPIEEKSENERNMSESVNEETEQQKILEHFELERRKRFEEIFEIQKETFKAQQRGELPVYRYDGTKPYKMQFFVFSSRIKDQPIWGIEFEIEGSFNEIKLQNFFDDLFKSFLHSKLLSNWQKKEYYRMRMQGIKRSEICSHINPLWSQMDTVERDKFARKLSRDYLRKKQKQKGDKNSEMPPQN